MRAKYVEIQEPAAPAFVQARRFTRKRLQPSFGGPGQDMPVEYVQAAPRKRRMKGLTTFNIVMMLIMFAVLITFYISNVVAVDGLMMEAVELDRQEQTLLQERDNLRAEINTLSSYNRIQRIAVEDLGLLHANQQPFSLTVFDLAEEQAEQ